MQAIVRPARPIPTFSAAWFYNLLAHPCGVVFICCVETRREPRPVRAPGQDDHQRALLAQDAEGGPEEARLSRMQREHLAIPTFSAAWFYNLLTHPCGVVFICRVETWRD
jgi:hypothetical protein